MTDRIIDISSPSTLIKVKHHQLVIDTKDHPERTVPIEDIGILIINHPSIILTQSVITKLTEAKGAVIFCGNNQMPLALCLPIAAHHYHPARLNQQIEASKPLKKRLWQSIIQCKINRQGDVLSIFNLNADALYEMAKRVRSGDENNLEAQSAQRYWPLIMGKQFRRDRYGHHPNALLNYGYAILRSVVARALCLTGLHPALGIFHSNRSNSFALADDMMEVWRPFIDLRVKQICNEYHDQEINQNIKQALLSLLNETVLIEGSQLPLKIAIERSASSLAKSFEQHHNHLILPDRLIEGSLI
jgi:CRISPR-associated protein Cas1